MRPHSSRLNAEQQAVAAKLSFAALLLLATAACAPEQPVLDLERDLDVPDFHAAGARPTDTQAPPVRGAAPPPLELVEEPGSIEDFIVNVGDRIFFDFDQSFLTAEARRTLDRQIAFLTRFDDYDIVIEGHADERGSLEYNFSLARIRAEEVARYLTGRGVSDERIDVFSFGETQPAVRGTTEAAYAQNRRAVTSLRPIRR